VPNLGLGLGLGLQKAGGAGSVSDSKILLLHDEFTVGVDTDLSAHTPTPIGSANYTKESWKGGTAVVKAIAATDRAEQTADGNGRGAYYQDVGVTNCTQRVKITVAADAVTKVGGVLLRLATNEQSGSYVIINVITGNSYLSIHNWADGAFKTALTLVGDYRGVPVHLVVKDDGNIITAYIEEEPTVIVSTSGVYDPPNTNSTLYGLYTEGQDGIAFDDYQIFKA